MKKNILVIMTDQQQAALSKAMGFPLDLTPSIDQLGREGVRFANAYTPSPICTPARVSFLSGRYVSGHGCSNNCGKLKDANFVDAFIVPKFKVMAGQNLYGHLKNHGYHTAIIGKNHAHADNDDFDYARSFHHRMEFAHDKSPDNAAFDEWLDGLQHVMSHQPAPYGVEQQLPHRIVDQSIAWIDQQKDAAQPFAMWVSFPEPHNPYQTCEPYFSMFDGDNYLPPATTVQDGRSKGHRWSAMRDKLEHALGDEDVENHIRRSRTNYFGMLRLIDDEVKRLVEHLKAQGLYDNTLIVFTSDHGDFTGEYGLIRKGVNLPECLIRIPLLFAGGGICPSTPSAHLFPNLVDLFPTICDYAGVVPPKGMQGKSLKPILDGNTAPAGAFDVAYTEYGDGSPMMGLEDFERLKPRMFRAPFLEGGPYWSSGSVRSLRKGDWKLIVDDLGAVELYHLATDPWELHNRATDPECTPIRSELFAALVAKMLQLQATQAFSPED